MKLARPTLNRRLGLVLLTFYGVGTIIGAGFYALLGKVAEQAGARAPWAFLLAAAIAMCSAYSFAELSRRFPVNAGEAHYVQQAFRREWLAALVGWMVIATGVVSAATLTRALAGFVDALCPLPGWLVMSLAIGLLCAIACRGIGQSAWFATAITCIEVGGLLAVCAFAGSSLGQLVDRWPEVVPTWGFQDFSGVGMGAYLAFYAFIGFEDLVNVAEETKNARRNLPWAIWMSLAVSSSLYFVVALIVVLSVPIDQLAASKSPLALLFGKLPMGALAMTLIGMLAGVNGALIQIVMASRVACSLAEEGKAPRWMSTIHPSWQTPLRGTVLLSLTILGLALWIPLTGLAQLTTTVLLAVFALVNAALVVILNRERALGRPNTRWSFILPVLGMVTCLVFVAGKIVSMLCSSLLG